MATEPRIPSSLCSRIEIALEMISENIQSSGMVIREIGGSRLFPVYTSSGGLQTRIVFVIDSISGVELRQAFLSLEEAMDSEFLHRRILEEVTRAYDVLTRDESLRLAESRLRVTDGVDLLNGVSRTYYRPVINRSVNLENRLLGGFSQKEIKQAIEFLRAYPDFFSPSEEKGKRRIKIDRLNQRT